MSDAAIANVVTGLVTITTLIIGFLTLWVKLKYGVEKAEETVKKTEALAQKTESVAIKIDANTEATLAGNQAAATNARHAATAASHAATVVAEVKESINKKLNGGMDHAIDAAIKPIRDALADHIVQYETDMKDIRSTLEVLRKSIR